MLTKEEVLKDALLTYLLQVEDAISGEMYSDFDEDEEQTKERLTIVLDLLKRLENGEPL